MAQFYLQEIADIEVLEIEENDLTLSPLAEIPRISQAPLTLVANEFGSNQTLMPAETLVKYVLLRRRIR